MGKKISKAEMKYVINSVIKYAYESIEDEKEAPTDFNKGRRIAYHEALEMIFNQLNIYIKIPKTSAIPMIGKNLFSANEKL